MIDSQADEKIIEDSKDGLLEDACSWIFNDPAFLKWWNHKDSKMLWIQGDPGKGKILVMALIREICLRLNLNPGSCLLFYFFCQNTIPESNTTISIVRGLITLLLRGNETLIHYLQRRYDYAGRQLFEGKNALFTLLDVLLDMLKDSSNPRIYLIIDALDECDATIKTLLKWIDQKKITLAHKVKWIVTSRNEVAFQNYFQSSGELHTILELNALHVSRAVDYFILCRVDKLSRTNGYSKKLQASIINELNQKANGTFLWVAMVCRELEEVTKRKVASVLKTFPPGLRPLYERMIERLKIKMPKTRCTVEKFFAPLQLHLHHSS